MFLYGVLTAVGFIAIAAKLSPKFLKLMLGYDWLVDLAVTLGIITVLSATGTISGMMIGVITGLAISLVLYVARKFMGYTKYVKVDGVWALHSFQGEWTLSYMINKIKNGTASIPQLVSQVKEEWDKPVRVQLKAVA